MPFIDAERKLSWEKLYEKGMDDSFLGVCMPMQFHSHVRCVFTVEDGNTEELDCSLERGDGVILFQNKDLVSYDFVIELVCGASNADVTCYRNGRDYSLDKHVIVPAAVEELYAKGLVNKFFALFQGSYAPNYCPIKFKLVSDTEDSLPPNIDCEVELRCLPVSENVDLAKIKKQGRQPWLKADKFKAVKNGKVVAGKKA